MILGIDIDGTLAKWPDTLYPDNLPNPSDLDPYPGSSEALNAWVDSGIKVVYITFRSILSYRETVLWLMRHGFPDSYRIWFGNEFEFKHDVLKKIGAFGIVEDNFNVCEAAVKNNFHAFLHTAPPYNKDIPQPRSLFWHTFDSWDDLKDKILKMKEAP